MPTMAQKIKDGIPCGVPMDDILGNVPTGTGSGYFSSQLPPGGGGVSNPMTSPLDCAGYNIINAYDIVSSGTITGCGGFFSNNLDVGSNISAATGCFGGSVSMDSLSVTTTGCFGGNVSAINYTGCSGCFSAGLGIGGVTPVGQQDAIPDCDIGTVVATVNTWLADARLFGFIGT